MSKLDAEIKARVPKPLKKRIAAIAKKRSAEHGNHITTSDLTRQILHKFVTELEAASKP